MRVGQEITRQNWPHPLIDDLSFASTRQPWTPYSWLAEIGMNKLWDAGGLRAAVAVQAILESAFIVLLGLCALEFSTFVHGQPRYLASILAAAMGGILSLAYLSFRPVTAALTGLALIAWLLLRDRRKNQKSKAVWLIPPITALLINIHFFAFFAPVWIASLLIGDAIQSRRFPRRWSALFLVTVAACCLTPMLPGMIRSIFDYAQNDVMVQSKTIAEFHPFYQGMAGHISAAIVALLLISAIWQSTRSKRIPLGELIWLAVGTALLFRLGRMAPLFAIIAAPIFAAVLPKLSDRMLTRKPILAIFSIVLVLTAWPIAKAFPRPTRSLSSWLNRNGPDAPCYPCSAADYVEENIPPKTHHLLCEFTWGGYIEWRLGDKFQTLMDGRTQLFPAEFWNTVALGSVQDRRAYFAKTPADAAILRTSQNPFAEPLTDLGWKVVYKDEFAEVLVPPMRKPETRNQKGETNPKSE